MRNDSNSPFSWGGTFGPRRAAPARKARPQRLELEAMEDRLVPAALDLTTAGAVGSFNGAIFQQASPQPTGTGVIHSFLRIQSHGSSVEQGYNTDARSLTMDQKKDLTFTRSVLASDVPQVTTGGVTYSEFLLDINQSQSSPLLSLDELRIYLGASPTLNSYDPVGHTLNGLAPAFDMGGGNSVLLNSGLSHGSGSGDMYLLVPSNLLQSAGNPYLYLYSKFGATAGAGANGGFEEWATAAVADNTLASLSGYVYADTNPDHVFGAGDTGLAGVTITISGTNVSGQAVYFQTTTDETGAYAFTGLVPGTYTLTETQPAGMTADAINVGTQVSGTAVFGADGSANAIVGIVLKAGVNGTNNNFGEIVPVVGGS